MQGHNEAFCHKLHPELKNKKEKHQEEVEDGKARKKIDCREEEEKKKSEENEANMAGKTAHEVFEEMPEPIKAIETAENEKIIDDGNIVRDSVIVIASEETGDSSDDPTLVANTKLDDQDNDGQSSMKNNTIFVYNEEGIDLVAELFVNPLDVSKSGEMVQESPGYEKEFPPLGIENGKKKIDDENNFELDVAEIDEAECNNPIAIESPIQRGLTLDEDRVGSPDDEVLVPNSQVQLVNEANILLARLEGKPNKKNKEDLNTRKLVAKISKSKIALLPAGPLKEKLATTHLGG